MKSAPLAGIPDPVLTDEAEFDIFAACLVRDAVPKPQGRPRKAVAASDPSRILANRARAEAPGASEALIHIAVADLLREQAAPNVYWFTVPNGAFVHPSTASKLRAMGVRAGVPDFAFVIGSKAHFLELKKAKGGSVSPEQRAAHVEIEAASGTVAVAKGFTAAVGVLAGWGVIKDEPN